VNLTSTRSRVQTEGSAPGMEHNPDRTPILLIWHIFFKSQTLSLSFSAFRGIV